MLKLKDEVNSLQVLNGKLHEKEKVRGEVILILTVLAVLIGEAVILSSIETGLLVYGALFFAFLLGVGYLHKLETHTKGDEAVEYKHLADILKTLMLIPLIRIFSFTLPLVLFRQAFWPLLISVPLFIAIYEAAKTTRLSNKDIGFTLGNWKVQLLVALTGVGLGLIEYGIIMPKPIVQEFSFMAILIPALILLVFSGFIEEIIFRGIIQSVTTRIFSGTTSVLFVSMLYASMYLGYGNLLEIGFVFLASTFYGIVFLRTKSLTGVMLSHGIANIVLLLIAPFLRI